MTDNNTVILVMAKDSVLQSHVDTYKIFTDDDTAIEYAKKRGYGKNGFSLSLENLEVGMMYYTECGNKYVKIIKLPIT